LQADVIDEPRFSEEYRHRNERSRRGALLPLQSGRVDQLCVVDPRERRDVIRFRTAAMMLAPEASPFRANSAASSKAARSTGAWLRSSGVR
jgi:hypothetical protein